MALSHVARSAQNSSAFFHMPLRHTDLSPLWLAVRPVHGWRGGQLAGLPQAVRGPGACSPTQPYLAHQQQGHPSTLVATPPAPPRADCHRRARVGLASQPRPRPTGDQAPDPSAGEHWAHWAAAWDRSDRGCPAAPPAWTQPTAAAAVAVPGGPCPGRWRRCWRLGAPPGLAAGWAPCPCRCWPLTMRPESR